MMNVQLIAQINNKLLALLLLVSTSSAFASELALIDAARQSSSETVPALLAEGADPNLSQPDGATALHWTVHRADSDSVAALLTAGADVNTTNRMGASPLFIAARNGDAGLIAQLLEAGANPNLELKMGETALMSAARAGTAEGIRLLVDAGAKVDVREQSRHQTALMWAAAQGHVAAAKELIQAGADLEARSKVRPMLMFADASNGGAFDHTITENLGGYSPLLFAALNDNTEMVQLLLDAGADIDGEAGNATTPLVVATHSGNTRVAVMLLEEGADPDAIGAGYNSLHAAILRGDQKVVSALLQHGANPNVRVKKATPTQRASEVWALRTRHIGATPYWLAAFFREPAIMRNLIAQGADPLLTNQEQYERLRDRESRDNPPSPDQRKVVGGFASTLQAAILGDSDRDRFYTTPYPDPVGEERLALETVIVAAEHGIDVNHTDYTDSTALHYAAARNFPTVIKELAEQGADINAVNTNGQTPLDIAILMENTVDFFNFDLVDKPGPKPSEVLVGFGAVMSDFEGAP